MLRRILGLVLIAAFSGQNLALAQGLGSLALQQQQQQQQTTSMPPIQAPSTPVVPSPVIVGAPQVPIFAPAGQYPLGQQQPQPPAPWPPPCYPAGSQGAVPLSRIAPAAFQASAASASQVAGQAGAFSPTQLQSQATGQTPGQVNGQTVIQIGPGALGGQPGQANQQQQQQQNQSNQQALNPNGPVPCKYANEFQEMVAESTGYILPMFGSDLFQGVPNTFAPVDHVSVPSDYVVGPGDEVMVRAWGQIDVNYTNVVDRGGMLYIPKVGGVRVAGLRYEQLRPAIHEAISRIYKDFELDVSMGQLRSIQVFVVGQAARPGAFTVGSLSTLVDALFASGGPSPAGSLRDIELRRGKQVISHFDLYDLLQKGDKSSDVKLQPGDVIYFNPVGPLAALSGSVNAPAIYELREKQTLQDALHLAGGLSTVASGQKVTVERIDERKVRHVEQIGLDYDGLTQVVKSGDIITVQSITGHFDNSVTLRGNVQNPGRYPWKENMRVKDLLPDYQSLVTREYWRQKVAVNRQALSGVTPGIGQFKTEVVHLSPEINWDYAVVERLNTDQLTTILLPFNLRNALTDANSQDNLPLMAGDIVTVFSQDDLRVPQAKRSNFVYLEGEFKAAGVYRALPGETLRQLVERVGGFTPNAYLFGAEFTRVSAQQEQQQALNDAVQRFQAEIERNAQVRLSSSINPNDPAVAEFQQSLLNQRRIVDQMKQIVPTGRVVLNLRPTDEDIAAVPELALEDGDRFVIPSRPAYVTVIGAINSNTASLLYSPRLRASDYVHLAGGTNQFADPKRMFVIRANGAVISRQGWGGIVGNNIENARLMPGDTIIMPENLDKGAFMRGLKDWSQILGQIGLAAAAIKVLSQ